MEPFEIHIGETQSEQIYPRKAPPINHSDVFQVLIPAKGLAVYLHSRAKGAILSHAQESPNIEVGGVIIGNLYEDPQPTPQSRLYIEIEDAVRADRAVSRHTRLTFTPDAWSDILTQMERLHPTKRVVGWYHTHPNFGIFLSAEDLFIQDNYFHENLQLAMVVDHLRGTAGLFVGSQREPQGICRSEEFTWDRELYHAQSTPALTAPEETRPVSNQSIRRQSPQATYDPPALAPYAEPGLQTMSLFAWLMLGISIAGLIAVPVLVLLLMPELALAVWEFARQLWRHFQGDWLGIIIITGGLFSITLLSLILSKTIFKNRRQ